MKTISLKTFLATKGKANVLIDLRTVLIHMRMDYQKRNDNVEGGETLCPKCDGTGNELFSMYRRCSECNGTGVKKGG